jgi:type II secretory pathway component PulF
MPVFAYKALQTDGTAIEGELEANGRQEAMRQIDGRGWRPVRIAERGTNGKPAKPAAPRPAPRPTAREAATNKEATSKESAGEPAPFKLTLGGKGRITPRMLENFTRLLSSLLAAGVPLSRALTILQKEAANPVARGRSAAGRRDGAVAGDVSESLCRHGRSR